jgi:tRNA(Ile)-lysidine synthase
MLADDPITDDEIRSLFAHVIDMPMAIAVSGGADSMALMHIAQRALALTAPVASAGSHPPLLVLTVDHGLRQGSSDDAAWVASQAAAAGLVCRVLTWIGDKPTQGIQSAARTARYRLMHDALVDEAASASGPVRHLLTAHHQEDQAETFLMRLARGSGVDGLSAMQPTARFAIADDAPDGADLIIHRPLLNLPKSRLIATLKTAGLVWREDPSNTRDDFERVRVRKALGVLAELGITSESIARSAGRLSRGRDALARQATVAVERHVHWHGGQYGSFPLNALNELPDDIAIRVLTQMIGAFSGASPAPRLSEIETLVDRIRSTTERAWPTRAATLGGCRLDWRPGGALRVWREAGRTGLPTLEVPSGTKRAVWDRRFEITTAPDLGGSIRVQALGANDWSTLKTEYPQLTKYRLPPGAAATLPACRLGDRLLAVPGLPVPSSPQIGAEFIDSRGSTSL